MLLAGEIVKPSGHDRTATWEGVCGTVTRVSAGCNKFGCATARSSRTADSVSSCHSPVSAASFAA